MDFTEEQIQRYSRQIILPDVGGKGQQKLREAKVLLVGAGGLGSPIGLYLGAAGIGTIGLIDGDVVDLSDKIELLYNNTENGAASFPWHDGVVSDVLFDDFEGGEDAVDGLHVARFSFSCRISRAD